MLPTLANGQAALAAYQRDTAGSYSAHSLQVLSITAGPITGNVVFQTPRLFTLFGLPITR